eukprot:3824982-Rhodomonas_salina.3
MSLLKSDLPSTLSVPDLRVRTERRPYAIAWPYAIAYAIACAAAACPVLGIRYVSTGLSIGHA